MNKPVLLVSFSGGRTSAYMMKWCYDNLFDQFELITVFANTGKEHHGTLDFVRDCEFNWGIPIIWVQAKHLDEYGNPLSKKGWRVGHEVVNYKTAARRGEPFEEMISILGIPSTNAPFCSDQLKRRAIESYLSSIGITNFHKAIGLRADEIDRVNPEYKKLKIIYPFVVLFPRFRDNIMHWWSRQSFDLCVPEDLGNCDACWKKDLQRLVRIAKNHRTVMDWWQLITDKYGSVDPRNSGLEPPFNFYRGNLSPKDIIEMCNTSIEQLMAFEEGLPKLKNGCGESCEVY